MPTSSHKKILRNFNKNRWTQFIQSDEKRMILPEISIVPGRSASTRLDTFTKQYFGGKQDEHHVKVLKKNDTFAGFVWQTSKEQLKKAVRWGVVHGESITAKVIGALGQYRVAAHELIIKGMISNTHEIKIALLDLYQDRFEALQKLESLTNQQTTAEDIIDALEDYISDLSNASELIGPEYFANTNITDCAPKVFQQLNDDIKSDITRVRDYIAKIRANKISIDELTRGRGYHSILEFVKTQMMHGLYELQGINQDISFSLNRSPALTRGRLNDFIEDARKEINDHHPDQRNLIGDKHHGIYAESDTVIYDFSKDSLTPEKERHAMVAISFIEGWDRVEWSDDRKQAKVVNCYGTDQLKEIKATRWQFTRDVPALFRKIGWTLVNMAKSLFVPTKPWIADTWKHPENENFHLLTDELFNESRKNKPVWHTPFQILKRIGTGFVDIVHGIYDAGKTIFNFPEQLWFDWYSTNELPDIQVLQTSVDDEIAVIEKTENDMLIEQLYHVVDVNNKKTDDPKEKISFATFQNNTDLPEVSVAHQDYHLTAGETNDILNSALRGLTEFSEFFTHEIFAKNPVAGALFLTTYGIAGAAILAPSYVAFLGPKLIAFENTIGYALGGSQFSAAIAAGSISGQVMTLAVDGLQHGPGSMLGNIVSAFTQNPTELAVKISIAWATGYLLAETGIEFLHDEVNGSSLNYIILGAKALIVSQALFHKQSSYKFVKHDFEFDGDEIIKKCQKIYDDHKEFIEKYKFVKWLSDHHHHFSKLSTENRCYIERYIDEKFKGDEADSLRKLIHKEKTRSIAYQLFAIPLNYIPALIRILIAFVVSVVAAIDGQPNPLQPIKHSFSSLFRKIKKDLARLNVFLAELSRWVVNIAASVIKMTASLISMSISRVGSIFGLQSGHGLHRFFANAHLVLRKFGELIYPNNVARELASSHPKSVVTQYQMTYSKLLDHGILGHVEKGLERETDSLLVEVQDVKPQPVDVPENDDNEHVFTRSPAVSF